MKWKTRRILALTLSAAFCVGLLAACGTADTDQDSQTSQEPESSDASSPDGTEETGAAGYYAGMVLAADEGQLTLQRYAPADGLSEESLADAADFVPENYQLSAQLETLDLDDESILRTLEDGAGGSVSLADIAPGSILLVQKDTQGAAADVVLFSYGEDRADQAAQVIGCADGTLEVSWYQAADGAEMTSYLDADLSGYTLDSATESLTPSSDTEIYLLQDGLLAPAGLEDLAAGDTVVISTSSAGELLRILVLEDQDSGLQSA